MRVSLKGQPGPPPPCPAPGHGPRPVGEAAPSPAGSFWGRSCVGTREPTALRLLGKFPLQGLWWVWSPPKPHVPLPPQLLLPVEILLGRPPGAEPCPGRGEFPGGAGAFRGGAGSSRAPRQPRAARRRWAVAGAGAVRRAAQGPGWQDGVPRREALRAARPDPCVRPTALAGWVNLGAAWQA